MTSRTRPLTPKQLQFIEAYVTNNGNATQAAQTAGYKGNYNTVSSTAVENLQKPAIKDAIARRQRELAESGKLPDADRITQELWSIARDSTHDPSPRVSALRTLADIQGMLQGGRAELPEGLGKFLGMIADASRVRVVEAPAPRSLSASEDEPAQE
jgi:hypothetical protein